MQNVNGIGFLRIVLKLSYNEKTRQYERSDFMKKKVTIAALPLLAIALAGCNDTDTPENNEESVTQTIEVDPGETMDQGDVEISDDFDSDPDAVDPNDIEYMPEEAPAPVEQ